MNKATLQTWIRSIIESSEKPIPAKNIFNIIKQKFPKEKGISLNRVQIILNQLYATGIIRTTFNENANEIFYLT